MHTTAGSGGVSVEGKKGPLGPKKADHRPCADIHASERTQEDYDGTKCLWPLSPAAHSGGNWTHLSLGWPGWQLGPHTRSG